MSSATRNAEVYSHLKDRLEDLEGCVSGVDSQVVTTIQLGGGGPSDWIEYEHNTGRATYYTTAIGFGSDNTCDEWPLTADEAQAVAEWAGIEC
jgi:hypothetical protein